MYFAAQSIFIRMKKLLLLTLLIPVLSFAQPTLTSADFDAEVGFQSNFILIDYFNAGSSGPNQTWNFSALPSGQNGSLTYIDPTTASEYSSFPNANLVISELGSRAYYDNESDGLYVLGLANSTTLGIWNNVEKQISYPLTYQTSNSDDYEYHLTQTGSPYVTMTSGNVSSNADGYGTLSTPAGTFSDVLRVKIIIDEIDTLTTSGIMVDYSHVYKVNYAFYVNGYPEPILSTSNRSENGFPTDSSAYYSTGISLGLAQHPDLPMKKLKLGPNPATDYVNAFFYLDKEAEITADLYTITGARIKSLSSGHYGSGANQMYLSLPSLAKGEYLIKFSVNGNTVAEPFLKE